MDVLREIPQKGEAMIQISRSRLLALTKRLCQAQYMNILLSSVAYVQNMHFTFTPRDVSEILGIEWSLFEKALIRAAPKYTRWGNTRIYSLDTMVRIAEAATRPQRLRSLERHG